MSLFEITPSRNPWVRSALQRFHESKLPSLLAYGLSLVSVAMGLIIYSTPAEDLAGAGYGPLLLSLPLKGLGIALVLSGSCLAFLHERGSWADMVPAGLLTLAYSFLAVSVAVGGGWWSGLFLLLLFAGYAAALVALTPAVRDD